MNAKNELIEKLLKVAKKHKVLTYPVLALVAVISVFNYFFSWSTGAGKRVVAVVMVLVMLVSQSYFLTSSANSLVDDDDSALIQEELQMNTYVQSDGDDSSDKEAYNTDGSDVSMEEESDMVNNSDSGQMTESGETGSQEESPAVDAATEDNYTYADDDSFVEDLSTRYEAVPSGLVELKDDDNKLVKVAVNFCGEHYTSAGSTTDAVLCGDTTPASSSFQVYKDTSNNKNYLKMSELISYVIGRRSDIDSQNDGCYAYNLDEWYTKTAPTIKYTATGENSYFPLGSLTDQVYLYCDRQLVKYCFVISTQGGNFKYSYPDGSSGEVTETVDGSSIASKKIENVPIDTVVTFSAFNKYGYKISKYNGVLINNDEFTVKAAGDSAYININLEWIGEDYTIKYATNKSDDPYIIQNDVTFDDENDVFIQGIGRVEEKVGYEFDKWLDPNKAECIPGTSILSHGKQNDWYDASKAEPSNPVVLTPVYRYLEIVKFSKDDNYEYTYSKPEYKEFVVGYGQNRDGNNGDTSKADFSYDVQVTSPSGFTLEHFGLDYKKDPNDCSKLLIGSANGPTRATKGSGFDGVEQLTVTIKVTDNKSDDKKTTSFPGIVIKVNPLNITLNPPKNGSHSKTYDGGKSVKNTFTSPLYATWEERGVKRTAEVSFTGAAYESADHNDAGVKINLTSAQLKLSSDLDKNNYTFDNFVMGKITPRDVYVNVGIKSNTGDLVSERTIKAGEKTPDFGIIDVEDPEGETGLIDDDNLGIHHSIGTLAVEASNFKCTRPDDLEEPGVYDITVEGCGNPNYNVKTNTSAKLNVIAEDPDNLYTTSETKNSDGWYHADVSFVITNAGSALGYNTVCVAESEGGDLVENLFSDCKDKVVYVRLKKSGEYGAVTAWKKETISVDTKAPIYKSYSLQTKGEGNNKIKEKFYESDKGLLFDGLGSGGLYFPTEGMRLSFGSYFGHDVQVSITFSDDVVTGVKGSGVKGMKYSLGDSGVYVDVPDGAILSNDDGTKTCMFSLSEVVLNKVGKVYFYATDLAGNGTEADKKVLTRKDGSTLWCVEQTGPTKTSYRLFYGYGDDSEGQSSVDCGSIDPDKYYSNCVLKAAVRDDLAGIHSITWNVKDSKEEEGVKDTVRVNDVSKALNDGDYTFTKQFAEKVSKRYWVSAVVKDNAGNELELPEISFKLDNVDPVIRVGKLADSWSTKVRVDFDVTDVDSGVASIDVVRLSNPDDKKGEPVQYHEYDVANDDGTYTRHGYFEQSVKGLYAIKARDYAGNEYIEKVELKWISSEQPDCPDIEVLTEPHEQEGEKKWYNIADGSVEVSVTPSGPVDVDNSTMNSTPVKTYFNLWKDNEKPRNDELIEGKKTITIPDKTTSDNAEDSDGHYYLSIWAQSLSEVKCDSAKHELEFFVDRNAPDIQYTVEKGTGSNLIVKFTITDKTSGVDESSIGVYHGKEKIEDVNIEQDGDSYVGSFEVTETGYYTIEAKDIAGNESKSTAFKPMSLKVNAIRSITTHSASVGAFVIKGTAGIESIDVSYRKFTDDNYNALGDFDSDVDSKGNVLISALIDKLDADTAYAYKITATSEIGEVLEYEGYFRTLAEDGSGVTINGVARYSDAAKEGTITVSLYKGNVCNMATEIQAGDTFTFSNIPNGNYNISATDGKYSKSMRILIEDGMIVYPATNIELILSGMSSSVEITTDETPDVTADNFDSIFEYDIINFDKDLVEVQGATVEFKLSATFKPVAKPNEISVIISAAGGKKAIAEFIDLTLHRIVTYEDGTVEKDEIGNLWGGAELSITIPLGEYANLPGLVVAQAHSVGEDMYTGNWFPDEDNNPNTYTITTKTFSTYAILYDPSSQGAEKPSTDESKNEQINNEPTETIGVVQEGTANPSQNGSINDGSTPSDDKKDTGSKKKPIDKDDTTRKGDNNGTSVGSLRSSGTAKTGDAAPVAAMATMMLISLAGIFVLRKKIK